MIESSVIVCTYNREKSLARTLASILDQDFPPDRFELLVVDNNSSDGTPAAVRRAAEAATPSVRYLFEGRQGKSYALNRAIREARGRLLIFTDDDVRVNRDWLSRIHQRFRAHEPDLIGGRVIPDWDGAWPDWFHPEYRGVIGFYDPAAEPVFLEIGRYPLPYGANFAARAEVFQKYGGFREDLSDGSLHRSEDYELFRRVLTAGGRILYAPDVVAHHAVDPSRLTRRYVRRWWMTQGMANSRMRLNEDPDIPKILGVPRWMYRRAIEDLGRCVGRYLIHPRCREAFYHETRLWRFYGFVKDRWSKGTRA